MVYLTFIKRADVCAEGWVLPKNVQQLYSLALFLEKKCGKPTALFCANDDGCIASSKLVNLVFSAHSIQATNMLLDNALIGQSEKFMHDLLSKAEVQSPQHIVIVLSPKQFEKFTAGNNSFAISYINTSESWRTMYLCAEKKPIVAASLPSCEVDTNVLRLFIDSIESLPRI